MADLADQIDDYICSFEGVGDLTMDTLAMLIFAWAVLALFLVWLCKFLYNKYVKKGNVPDTSKIGTSPSEKLRKTELKELSASKDIKGLDLAAKSLAPGSKGIVKPTSRSGSIDLSSRKRLSRKSPGPELRKPLRSIPPPSNVVGPESSSVTWTSQVFRWLYSDLVIVNELLQSWVTTLNENTKKTVESTGVAVEIVRVLPESPPPNLSNIYCESLDTQPSEMTITLDCEATPVLQIKTFRQKAGKVETSHYKATISRIRARLSIALSYNTLKGDMRVEGFPDIRITLNSVGAIKTLDQDEKQLQEVINEILTTTIRDTIYPVDFSIYSTCPRAVEMDPPEIPVNLPIHYDSLAHNMEHLNPLQAQESPVTAVPSGRRLLVKVVKGEGLTTANDPYCVIEMDEPPQKNQTGARQGTTPFWDEHFLFDLSEQSAEILFEIYDRPANGTDPPKFLGLGLVGIDELAVGPASSQILTLQPRPYETESVSGAITVEFVFIEGAEVPAGRRPYKFKEALKITNPAVVNGYQNGQDLADTAVKAIEGGALTSSANPSRSTLIIHSVQRKDRPFYYTVELNQDGQIQVDESVDVTQDNNSLVANVGSPVNDGELLDDTNDSSIITADVEVLENGTASEVPGEPVAQSSPMHQTNGYNHSLPRDNQSNYVITDNGNDPNLDDRGRTRKKRDFFGTLKRRLGRSKSRAKSVDRGMIPIDADNPNAQLRSVSADRGGLNSNNTSAGPRLVVPTLDQSRRSSLSESSAISGFSSASTKTYVHEASTLVLETIENGVKRHFLVPLAVAQRPRWRRKGTKLHIYNDHTFVAKHLSGGLTCDVCNRSIPRRPGKQGYECRDCMTKCHKQCHVRVPQACTNPTVLSMELSSLPMLSDSNL
ncbi:uncharacterized protein LOC119071060 isoform X2 [Bradysia coprophila]|uniref:uncharacterized protein LOC119071060 isoform X2 n=1 Tax=Bradysia coprophila TaxID=38358 RepID=UPI00187D8EE0|nr:uncharacterized protein LOC119071060 isoform X2 [Bradysia coprophila]